MSYFQCYFCLLCRILVVFWLLWDWLCWRIDEQHRACDWLVNPTSPVRSILTWMQLWFVFPLYHIYLSLFDTKNHHSILVTPLWDYHVYMILLPRGQRKKLTLASPTLEAHPFVPSKATVRGWLSLQVLIGFLGTAYLTIYHRDRVLYPWLRSKTRSLFRN